jgi:hypothetical protein
VRSDPLGVDGEYHRYWVFEHDRSRVYVEKIQQTDAAAAAAAATAARTAAEAPTAAVAEAPAAAVSAFASTSPDTRVSEWGFYKSKQQVVGLLKSLDDRGVRERALKRALEEKLPLLMQALVDDTPEDPDNWKTTGEMVGKRVRRVFSHGHADGVVTRWIPQDDEGAAFWHVVHEDGDQEDLELHELQEALEHFENKVTGNAENADQEEPDFLAYENTLIKPRVSSEDLGLEAVREHLAKIELSVYEGLKQYKSGWNSRSRSDGSPKSGTPRSAWLAALKGASSSVDFAKLVLTLEEAVRGLQETDDVRVNDNSDDWKSEGHDFIGVTVQRCADGDTTVTGTVTTFCPSDEMGESTLLRVVYETGDVESEDYDEADIVGLAGAKEEGSDVIDISESTPKHRRMRDADAQQASQDTLWCSWDYRNNWISALKSTDALHTVVMAVDCFFDHCVGFGVGEPLEEEKKKTRTSRSKKEAAQKDTTKTLKWQAWDMPC